MLIRVNTLCLHLSRGCWSNLYESSLALTLLSTVFVRALFFSYPASSIRGSKTVLLVLHLQFSADLWVCSCLKKSLVSLLMLWLWSVDENGLDWCYATLSGTWQCVSSLNAHTGTQGIARRAGVWQSAPFLCFSASPVSEFLSLLRAQGTGWRSPWLPLGGPGCAVSVPCFKYQGTLAEELCPGRTRMSLGSVKSQTPWKPDLLSSHVWRMTSPVS